jgi:class 3 adenylate cyclase
MRLRFIGARLDAMMASNRSRRPGAFEGEPKSYDYIRKSVCEMWCCRVWRRAFLQPVRRALRWDNERLGQYAGAAPGTVFFSDLSGFTALNERLDPEDVRDIVNKVWERAGEIVGRYDGRINKLLGDAVMAVFGDPVAHEDDPLRAVRAALELHEAGHDSPVSFA